MLDEIPHCSQFMIRLRWVNSDEVITNVSVAIDAKYHQIAFQSVLVHKPLNLGYMCIWTPWSNGNWCDLQGQFWYINLRSSSECSNCYCFLPSTNIQNDKGILPKVPARPSFPIIHETAWPVFIHKESSWEQAPKPLCLNYSIPALLTLHIQFDGSGAWHENVVFST